MNEPQRALVNLLLRWFTAREARVLLSRVVPHAAFALPAVATDVEVASAVVESLQRHRAVDSRLFETILREKPECQGDVERVARAWLGGSIGLPEPKLRSDRSSGGELGGQSIAEQPAPFCPANDGPATAPPRETEGQLSFAHARRGAARWDVFLAHATEDKPLARELYSLLGARGLRPFLDERSILDGTPWAPAISAALRSSAVIAVLVSGEVESAYYFHDEVRLAIDLARADRFFTIRVVPVWLAGRPQRGVLVPYGIGSLQGPERPEAVEHLVVAVRDTGRKRAFAKLLQRLFSSSADLDEWMRTVESVDALADPLGLSDPAGDLGQCLTEAALALVSSERVGADLFAALRARFPGELRAIDHVALAWTEPCL